MLYDKFAKSLLHYGQLLKPLFLSLKDHLSNLEYLLQQLDQLLQKAHQEVKILVLKHYKYMLDKNLMLQLKQQGYHYIYQMHLHLMMQIKQLEFLH